MTSKPTPKGPKPKASKGPRRKPKATQGPAPQPKEAAPIPPLTVRNPHAAAIDVHSDNHVVCVGPDQVKTFGAYTVDLEAIADHLFLYGVTTVVLESTSVYWIPLFEVLEGRGFEVFLIEPSQASHCGARPKSDPHDCQWLQRLHGYGLLRPSFRPPASVLALRGYWRQRQNLVRYAAGHVQHVQKALEQMNVKLTEVSGDLMGVTGTRIIEAIVAGERDPRKLACLRDGRCRRTEEEYVKALEGHWRQEHLFELKQVYELYRFYHQKITECDEQIQGELTRLPDLTGGKAFQAHKLRGQQEQRPSLRRGADLVQGLGGGPDADRRDRREDRLGDPRGDRRRRQPIPDGEAFCQLAAAVSAVRQEQQQPTETEETKGDEPDKPGLADGGAGLGQREDAAGGVLPSDEVASGWAWGDHGDGAQAGGAGVSAVEIRDRVRASIDGGIHGKTEKAAGAETASPGRESGI